MHQVVIQSGGLVEQERGAKKEELLAAIRCGADAIFRSKGGAVVEEDIDTILEKAERYGDFTCHHCHVICCCHRCRYGSG